MTSLNGTWDFRDQSGEYTLAIALPGDGISALFAAGKIADPYWGQNEYDQRWIAEREWIASRQFTLTDDACDLVLSGLDTVVDVHINGNIVLRAENAFRTYRVNLSSVAKPGVNEIALHFKSAVSEAAARQEKQRVFIPYSTDNCPIPHGNMLRKPQCDFGWDWNIALAPMGVWGDIVIQANDIARLDDIQIRQSHAHDIATVSVTATIQGDGEGKPVHFQLGGRSIEANVTGRQAQAEFKIENPELWWPAGQGAQPLYDLQVRFGPDVAHRRIGLRDLQLVVQDDDAGRGFKFRVNGRDVFAKGANWIPADALSGRIDPVAVRGLLQSAADAHMNMIRVWGGGRYEPTWFYDFCDELGLMVWQDFMFACSLYPADPAFLDEVTAEVTENVRRLNHHASIAVWCGDNELIGALNWFPQSRENRDLYLVMYDRLNRTIETALKSVLPDANWWPSSPSAGHLDFSDGWHNDRSGDMHFWSVWHEGRDFEHYRDIQPRFVSEFGFQSYPSLDVIRSFAAPEDMNIAAPVIESHQKNKGGNARIAETMFRYFRFPVDFENFVYLSQVQQGLAIKTAVSYWRSLKPHCMGSLIWQLNDTWPCASWSSLDYGGGWKLLHHMAADFYQPVLVTIIPQDGSFLLRAVSDLGKPADIQVECFACDMAGNTRPLGTADVTVSPDRATDVMSLDQSAVAPHEMIGLSWRDGADSISRDIFAPHPFKSYDLLPPGLSLAQTHHNDCFELTVTAKHTALFVAVETDVAGRFSDNAFAVLPAHPVTLTFTPENQGVKPNFKLRDLHSATYGPRI